MIFDFIPTPKDAQQAAFQARIMARGEKLIADGYKIKPFTTVAGCYFVHSPEGACYMVDTLANRCNCPCCEEHGFCKHLIGVLLEDDRLHDEAMVAEYETRGY